MTTTTSRRKPRGSACARSMGMATALGLFGFASVTLLGMAVATVASGPLPGPTTSRPSFLLVGDSLTWHGSDPNGWATQLQASYNRSVEVDNRGQSGYSTRTFLENAMPALSSELETSSAPVLITLWFGTNDAALVDGPAANKHVPLDEYRVNLVKIVKELQRAAPQAKILVVSPPVVDDDVRRRRQVTAGGKSSQPIDRSNMQAGLYAIACGQVAQSLEDDGRVSFLDLHSFMMTAYDTATARARLLVDGLHLSAKGHGVVFELVRSHAQRLVAPSVLGAQ